MSEKAARQAELYELWGREIEGWVAPLVRRLGWAEDDKADLLTELKHHTVRGLLKRREEIENLRAFCVTIAINFIRDKRQARKSQPEPAPQEAIEKQQVQEERGPDQEAASAEAAEAQQEMYELIRRIRYEVVRAEWDAPFSLVFEWQMSLREAAGTLGQPYSSVEYRVVRAVTKITEKLQEIANNDPELMEKMVTAFGEERTAPLLRKEPWT